MRILSLQVNGVVHQKVGKIVERKGEGYMKGQLILENGMVFEGKVFGETGQDVVGEVVFNTSMTGYQEILTDPSYYGQIVTLTFPLIGNYGINVEDIESNAIKARALIVKEPAKLPNNYRCEMPLSAYLKQHGVMGLKGIDTRALTKVLRDVGTMKGVITTRSLTQKEIKERLSNFSNKEAVDRVSTAEKYELIPSGEESCHLVVWDFGVKKSILNHFLERGCKLTVMPKSATYDEIESLNADGLFLTNGPGDPEDLPEVAQIVKKLSQTMPIIGICLGHQILSWAFGGTTTKLKFGHRGGNHPVKDIRKDRVVITAQNHGYVVDTLPQCMEVTHINVNDKSIEGMAHKTLPIMSVQYHPEASPGPMDSLYIFDEFLNVVKGGHCD